MLFCFVVWPKEMTSWVVNFYADVSSDVSDYAMSVFP